MNDLVPYHQLSTFIERCNRIRDSIMEGIAGERTPEQWQRLTLTVGLAVLDAHKPGMTYSQWREATLYELTVLRRRAAYAGN